MKGKNNAVSKGRAFLQEVQGCVWQTISRRLVWLEQSELQRMHSRLEVLGPGHGGLRGHQRSWDFTPCEMRVLSTVTWSDVHFMMITLAPVWRTVEAGLARICFSSGSPETVSHQPFYPLHSFSDLLPWATLESRAILGSLCPHRNVFLDSLIVLDSQQHMPLWQIQTQEEQSEEQNLVESSQDS